MCATGAVSGACDPPPWGLVSWWKGEGNANDSLGANNGVLSASGASYASGMVGQAFRFDGTNGYMQIPDSSALKPTNVTVEAWVWLDPALPANSGGEQIVFKKNTWSAWFEGYSLLKETIANGDGTSSDRFQFCISQYGNQVAINSQTIAQRGVWYHVAATYDGNQSILYVSGVAEASATPGFAPAYDTTPLFIGTTGTWTPYLSMFGGLIDEVSIYNRALSAGEIAAIYTTQVRSRRKRLPQGKQSSPSNRHPRLQVAPQQRAFLTDYPWIRSSCPNLFLGANRERHSLEVDLAPERERVRLPIPIGRHWRPLFSVRPVDDS